MSLSVHNMSKSLHSINKLLKTVSLLVLFSMLVWIILTVIDKSAVGQEGVAEKSSIQSGKNLFTGMTKLRNKGAACISCHNIDGVGVLGGGNLGPDLTDIAQRFGGEKGMEAWLSNLATPTMKATYQKTPLGKDEIVHLAKFFAASHHQAAETSSLKNLFLLLGLIGFGLIILLIAVIGNKRLVSVRHTLMKHKKNDTGKDS